MPKSLSNPPLAFVEAPPSQSAVENFSRHGVPGYLWGFVAREKLFFWDKPLTGSRIVLEHLKHISDIVVEIGLLIGVFVIWFFVGQEIFAVGGATLSDVFALEQSPSVRLWFWISVLVLCYVLSRWWRARRVHKPIPMRGFKDDEVEIDPGVLTWEATRNIPKKNRVNMCLSYAKETHEALEIAFALAMAARAEAVTPAHVFVALIQFSEVESIFIRLGLWREAMETALGFKKDVVATVKKHRGNTSTPVPLSLEVKKLICSAYEEAYKERQEEVGLAELLLVTIRGDEKLQELLYNMGVEAEKVTNVVAWVRVGKILHDLRARRHRAIMRAPKGETNKAMTAIATPFLNNFSIDITKQVLFDNTPPTIGREKQIEDVMRIIEGGGKSVLLVGENGVGKTALIYAIAQLMLEDAVPEALKDSRLVQISIPALLAGGTASDAAQRLLHIFQEISKSGNIVLCIEGIEDMAGVSSGGAQSLDVSEVLAQELEQGYFFTIATTEPEHFRRYVSHTAIANVMQTVEVPPMTVDETVRVLEAKVGGIEYVNHVWFSYAALEAAARLAGRFMFDQHLPAPAIEVIKEAANLAHKTKGKNALVTDQDVATIIAGKTNIPVTAVSEDEGQKLLRLEEEMHKRVIGQDEAVVSVANALRRARTELKSDKRPIANFLFLGPTGVGKTELAKTIAEVYFGSENNMIRLDMSEYQDASAIQRMLGTPGEQGTGVLTEAIRKKPFSLVLLDELEKANPDILNVFLQVMDDGRITDSVGRTVDCTNIILIATSNAGTAYIQSEIARGTGTDKIKDALMRTELGKYYRPEFLNRFDGIIVFKPIEAGQMMKIAGLMLNGIVKKLDERGITLRFDEAAVADLSREGFDPQFGARPLRRVIENRVENKLAALLLEKKIKRGGRYVFGLGDTVTEE